MAAGRHRAWAVASATALVLVGAAPADAAITYVNRQVNSSTSSSLTLSRPNGTSTNDVLIATISGAGTANITAPSGWTLIDDRTTANAAMRTFVFFRVATAGEPGSYAFASPGARSTSGGVMALRGANPVVPIDAVAGQTGASGNAVAPVVTTTSANEWLVTVASFAADVSTTAAAGTTERVERRGDTTIHAATSAQVLAGTTATRTVTPSSTTAAWSGHTIAIRDAATASLSVSHAASASFTSSLDDGDNAETWSLAATISDTRTTASAGWQLQVTSTTLTTGTRSLPTTATDVTGVSGAACDNNAPCELPINNVSFPVDVPAGTTPPTAVKFYNAAAGTGLSRIDVNANFSAWVPQNAFAGTYASTVTISVISGP